MLPRWTRSASARWRSPPPCTTGRERDARATPYRNALSESFDSIAASLRDDAWATPPLPREERLALLRDDPALATVATEAPTVLAVPSVDRTWRDEVAPRRMTTLHR